MPKVIETYQCPCGDQFRSAEAEPLCPSCRRGIKKRTCECGTVFRSRENRLCPACAKAARQRVAEKFPFPSPVGKKPPVARNVGTWDDED